MLFYDLKSVTLTPPASTSEPEEGGRRRWRDEESEKLVKPVTDIKKRS